MLQKCTLCYNNRPGIAHWSFFFGATLSQGCQMAIARSLKPYVFGPLGFWTMAPLCYAAKFDPFLSLDCAPTPSTLAQSKERKGSNFAICPVDFAREGEIVDDDSR